MARAMSFALAIAASLGLLFLPAMRGGELSHAAHGLLAPLLLLVCAGFVHGVGYVPRTRFLRACLHPALLWTLTAALGLAFASQIATG